MKFKSTISTTGTSNCIVIPKPVIDTFGLKSGKKLTIIVNDDGIMVVNLREKDI